MLPEMRSSVIFCYFSYILSLSTWSIRPHSEVISNVNVQFFIGRRMRHYYGYEEDGYQMVLISNYSDLDVERFIKQTQLKQRDEEIQQMKEQLNKCHIDIKTLDEVKQDIASDIEMNKIQGDDVADFEVKSTEMLEDTLRGLCGLDWNKYLQNFRQYNIGDDDLLDIRDSELRILIPKIGPRSRFRKWLGEMRGVATVQTKVVDTSGNLVI